MKTNNRQEQDRPNWLQRAGLVGMGALATLGGLPVHAATKSFPDYPLMTGGSAIPPNIMLILDDSGSMEASLMRADGTSDDTTQLSDNVSHLSYVNNTIYYNPAKTYLPWRTSSQNQDDRLPAANFRSAASSLTSYTGSAVDLRSATNNNGVPYSYFYVPKSNVANPGTTASNYDKYRITTSSSATSYDGGVVQRFAGTLSRSGSIGRINANSTSDCIRVDLSWLVPTTFTLTGDRDVDLFLYRTSLCNSASEIQRNTQNQATKTITLTPTTTTVYLRASNPERDRSSSVSWSAFQENWEDMTPRGNTAALQRAELQNFANWFQYHRSRNKMAKAGAAEAFGRLGRGYRVGYDSIWNRGGASENTGGNTPAFPIPYQNGGGLFEGSNRDTFYARLRAASASGNTPLKGALQRAARYYKTDDPWKVDATGAMLSCRQNYAILTTDGYWNNDSGYSSVGNADAATNRDLNNNPPQYPDTYPNTLADVAYEYWRTDLRPGMANNVLTSAADPASWQHMVTFGVSIGLKGTLDPNNPPPSPWNVNPSSQGPRRIDDLWHASLNGRGKFVVASDADAFASALQEALATIDSRSASGSNIASSSTKTDTTTLTFVAGFTSGSWIGDLIASPFNAALTGVSSTPDWILSQTFGTGKPNANFKDRTVLTFRGGNGVEFNSAMTGAAAFAARTGLPDAVTAADNIAYLRGDQSKEAGQAGGSLRRRAHPIGDIVNSSPAYSEDTRTLFIGANDGMLHAINANSADTANRGKVVFSYVPRGIDPAIMATLSATEYSHRYFVDGQIDVSPRTMSPLGRNILVGALGRGGRGVFALDVTNPAAMDIKGVLWDRSYSDAEDNVDQNMGYVVGRVLIRKGNGDKLLAFVPNGIDSPSGSATLFVYELFPGGGIQQIHELVADAGGGNGLTSVGLADTNGDGKVDIAYGGDLKGNVWRWDFSNGVPAANSATKLFQAIDAGGNPQPITGGLGLGRDRDGTIFVGFGTGRFISSTDMPGVAAQTTQTLYGIKDQATTIAGRAALQQRQIQYSGTLGTGEAARGFENYSLLPNGKQGWYIDLPVPERVISSPTIYGSGMYISTVIPPSGSDCASSVGSGFLNALNLFTGTSPENGSYFAGTGPLGDGVVGSVGVSGGMPTEANVTSTLVTVGTGAFTTEAGGAGNTSSQQVTPPSGGRPARVNWREIPPGSN